MRSVLVDAIAVDALIKMTSSEVRFTELIIGWGANGTFGPPCARRMVNDTCRQSGVKHRLTKFTRPTCQRTVPQKAPSSVSRLRLDRSTRLIVLSRGEARVGAYFITTAAPCFVLRM